MSGRGGNCVNDSDLLVIALGIALGLFYFQRTGYSPGGIITPGFIALELASPEKVAFALVSGCAVSALLVLVVRTWGFYGRQRTGVAMLIALALKMIAGSVLPASNLWIGWVIPGLIGADIQRQGFLPTIAAAMSSAFAASFGAVLFSWAGGMF